MTSSIAFARRHNEDATIDSICTRCYQTIASERTESNLLNAEQRHACDPNLALDRLQFTSQRQH